MCKFPVVACVVLSHDQSVVYPRVRDHTHLKKIIFKICKINIFKNNAKLGLFLPGLRKIIALDRAKVAGSRQHLVMISIKSFGDLE